MEKFLNNIEEAEKIVRAIDHMAYTTFPLFQDKRILIKILLETKTAITNYINAILQYEYIFKRINLYKNAKTNFKTFTERCSRKYQITQEEIEKIIELFNIVEKHKQSSMEFTRNEKIVILSENMQPETITIQRIKEFLNLAKNLGQKTKNIILR